MHQNDIIDSIASIKNMEKKSSVTNTFLSYDDFSRAQNMTFAESESAPVTIPLNDPEMHYTYYEGDMMIQESDEKKVTHKTMN